MYFIIQFYPSEVLITNLPGSQPDQRFATLRIILDSADFAMEFIFQAYPDTLRI